MSNFKKIILVITDSRGVSQAFVTDDFQYLLLEEAIALAKRGILIGVHLVEGAKSTYIRSDNNNAKEDNLDSLSVPAGSLPKKIKDLAEDERVSAYAKAYGKFLELRFERDELLYLGRVARIPKKEIAQRLKPLASDIKDAAARHGIDPHLIAAILIDELPRMGPDDLLDVLGKLDVVDTTVGLAQVKMSTARDMIKKKYYPADPNISQDKLYELLKDDRASIEFAAAYLAFIKEFRIKRNRGISAAELASCYSEGLLKRANSRGKQIATKLRILAKETLD